MTSLPPSQPELSDDPGESVELVEPAAAGLARTGHPRVDGALDRLEDIETLPVADHVEVYDDVQQQLAAAMDDARDRQPPTGAG